MKPGARQPGRSGERPRSGGRAGRARRPQRRAEGFRLPHRYARFEARLRKVAGGLRDLFFELAELVEALPRPVRETSPEDLDGDPSWPDEVRAVALCVMNDDLRPAVRALLDAAAYRPGRPFVPDAELPEELRQVFALDLTALRRRQPGRAKEEA